MEGAMTTRTNLILASFVFCLLSCFASADSIPISGVAYFGAPEGNCCFNGDFSIGGPGLSLLQGTPDGPAFIGACDLGTVCDFSYSIGSAATFCIYCLGFSEGSLGTKTADFLDPSLTFTGSEFDAVTPLVTFAVDHELAVFYNSVLVSSKQARKRHAAGVFHMVTGSESILPTKPRASSI
jgi:hypothetical protein